eukprot:4166600-Alexandrium_andersonii.AAC.1
MHDCKPEKTVRVRGATFSVNSDACARPPQAWLSECKRTLVCIPGLSAKAITSGINCQLTRFDVLEVVAGSIPAAAPHATGVPDSRLCKSSQVGRSRLRMPLPARGRAIQLRPGTPRCGHAPLSDLPGGLLIPLPGRRLACRRLLA